MASKIGDYKYYWKIIVLATFIIIISLSHYVTGTEHKYHGLHEIYRRLYYIPIILSAFWFGLKGGIICAIVVSFFYLPHVIYQWGGNFLTDDLPRTIEIVLYNIIGFVTGFLSQKQMDATRSLKKTVKERDESYDKLKHQAEVLVQTEGQLRRADRLSALGKLSAGIAHEVRNPLASIKGTAEILSDKFKPGDKEYEFVEILIREVNRLDAVVAEFLDFAKPKPPELKLSNINDIILSVLKLTEHQITISRINLRTQLEDSLPSVYVDPEQMKQVFLNLIINSVQAMPDGGILEVGSNRNSSEIVCKFSDTGVGISKEQQGNLFTPFYTSKKMGTGLGLAIVYRIIEGHKGKIRFSTKENEGTTFTICLPIENE
ncbi:MAG: two-component sensor kinase [Candidatus Scalindua rubra]|uniref:histidine kinase n=1 Tax=Candidatus Scalindua rubra TaxID=1872076 RepID=A0A1E3XBI0_9BACT|nr:MAG: two-component sensor kinase [Candidatus Scalindua rubra]